jgi:hypothetical protein
LHQWLLLNVDMNVSSTLSHLGASQYLGLLANSSSEDVVHNPSSRFGFLCDIFGVVRHTNGRGGGLAADPRG